jgi:hypothetical protein
MNTHAYHCIIGSNSFDRQHTTPRTVIQQRLSNAAYDDCHIAISLELEQLKCEKYVLCGGTIPPLD